MASGFQNRTNREGTPVPIIKVSGNHHEVGLQLGRQLKDNLAKKVKKLKESDNWDKVRREAEQNLQISRKVFPEYIREIEGAAESSGLDLCELFSTVCDELHSDIYSFTGGCSDLAVTNDVTEDGSVLIAHNNDILATLQDSITLIHYQVEGEPEIIAVGAGGLGISVGYNSAGISLTGNALYPNDVKVGVPRMLLVRRILASNRIGEAVEASILKARASNYNQIIADQNGEIYSIEGSATDYEPMYAVNGYLVHTNHYTSPRMRKYESDPGAIGESIVRYNRCLRLLKTNIGQVSVDSLKAILSDHANYPESICFHGEEVKTTFSVIINLSTLKMWLARGNPCENDYCEYDLF